MENQAGTLDFGDQKSLDASLSTMVRGLQESGILRITRQVRAMLARGETVVNLTVGDFDPRYFPIPKKLSQLSQNAVARGETNYPNPEGLPGLRQAISDYVFRTAGVRYPLDAIVVCSGGRPVLYGAYRAIINPGDKVVFSVPSWQNDSYSWLTAAEQIVIEGKAESGFQPTLEQLRPYLGEASMICICSPGNPTGTVMGREHLREILEAIVEENKAREAASRRPVFILHDQMYGTLVSHGQEHVYPASIVPECVRWLISVDGVSKSYAGTGLRLGWMLVAPAVGSRIRDLLSHAGAWAPRAEQAAVAEFLNDADAIAEFRAEMDAHLAQRLEAMRDGFEDLKSQGYPVDSINPQGAIYFSAQFRLHGKSVDGQCVQTDEQIRNLLLEKAGVAVVPFQAFGVRGETGWFRLSAGAVSLDDIYALVPRLKSMLDEVH
jgi:aspartate aminotransferase